MSLLVKRAFDICASLILLVLFSPVLLIAAIAIAVDLGRPVLFRQNRPGLHGRIFSLLKFRTMSNARGEDGELLSDQERLTKAGRFVRRASIDELPELYHVLMGDMSLVGPRPLLPEYLEVYTPEQNRRHEVRPGITGLAQISGRQAISFSKRLELDVQYVDQWSLWLDLKIMLLTIPKVFGFRGVLPDQQIDEVDDLGLNSKSELGKRVRNREGCGR